MQTAGVQERLESEGAVEGRRGESTSAGLWRRTCFTGTAMGPLVLIVDDCAETRAVLGCSLSQEGFRVSCAENGRAALEVIEAGLSPDVVLLDRFMPVMDGESFLTEIQARGLLADVPVLMVTSSIPGAGGARRGADHGNVPFLGKHMSVDHLLVALRDLLRPRNERAA